MKNPNPFNSNQYNKAGFASAEEAKAAAGKLKFENPTTWKIFKSDGTMVDTNKTAGSPKPQQQTPATKEPPVGGVVHQEPTQVAANGTRQPMSQAGDQAAAARGVNEDTAAQLKEITSDMTPQEQAEARKYNNAIIAQREKQYKQNQKAMAAADHKSNLAEGAELKKELKSDNPLSRESLERATQTLKARGKIPDNAMPLGTGKGDYVAEDGKGGILIYEPEKGYKPRRPVSYDTWKKAAAALGKELKKADGKYTLVSDMNLKNIISAVRPKYGI